MINWKKYLKTAGIPLRSSTKPINAKGKQKMGIKFPINKFPNDPSNTKEIPPPLGVGILCELLLFGLSRTFNLKKFLVFLSISQEQKKQLKEIK